MAREKSGNTPVVPFELTYGAPLDSKMKVGLKSDLTSYDAWKAPEAAGANKNLMFCYFGMLVYVAEDTAENNGLYVLQNNTGEDGSDANSLANPKTPANIAALKADNWVRISQTDTTIAKKLDKDFVTSYAQGTLEDGTVFAARSDNTPDANNVYITGSQIKAFAAAAVSDKGTFATDEELAAAYPTPEAGWTATVLETGTTWIATEQEGGLIIWVDSKTASGVTSVNGKTGIVTLTAADIDDVYSDTETDTKISEAVSGLNTTLSSQISTVDGKVTNLTATVNSNTESISQINTTLGNEDSGLVKEVGDNTAAIQDLSGNKADKATTLAGYGITDAYTKTEVDGKIDAINTATEGLSTQITDVKATADKAASDITALTTRVSTAESDIDSLEANVTTLTTGLSNVYTKTESDAKYVATDSDASLKSVNIGSTVEAGSSTTLKVQNTTGSGATGIVLEQMSNYTTINKIQTGENFLQGNLVTDDGNAGRNAKIATDTWVTKQISSAITDDVTAENVGFSSSYSGTYANVENAVTGLTTAKADKATTLAGYGITNAYTKTEVESAIDAKIGTFVEIDAAYNSLEDITDPKSNTIYLIPISSTEPNNIKEEYIWTGTAWELIGTTAVDISSKQDKTLSSPITVDGTSQTTVEGALAGINTALDNYVKTDSNASLSGLTIEAPEDNDYNDIALTFKQHTTVAPNTAPSFTIRQDVMGDVFFDIVGGSGLIGGTAIVNKSSGKLVTDTWLADNYLEKDAQKEYEFYALQLTSGLTFKDTALIYPYAGEFADGEKYKILWINDGALDDALVGIVGNYTTRGNMPSVPGKLIVTDPTVVVSDEGQAILPSLKDGSAVTVYTKDKADTEFAKADASNISNAASWKAKLGFISTTGDETITGVKTFSDGINIAGKVEKTVTGSTTQTAKLSDGVKHATIRWISASTEINYEVCISDSNEVVLYKEVISGDGENGITEIANNVITFGSEGKAYIVEY